jgi:hypothetical protein
MTLNPQEAAAVVGAVRDDPGARLELGANFYDLGTVDIRLAVDSGAVFFLAEGGDHGVWIEEAGTDSWSSLGGLVVGGVAAVGSTDRLISYRA